jgi:hypothetical protein
MTTGLFDKLYAASKETLDELKKPQIKKSLQRKLCSAFDDAENKIIDADKALEAARGDFQNYDINRVIEQQFLVEKLRRQQTIIKAEYKVLFDVEMKTLDV